MREAFFRAVMAITTAFADGGWVWECRYPLLPTLAGYSVSSSASADAGGRERRQKLPPTLSGVPASVEAESGHRAGCHARPIDPIDWIRSELGQWRRRCQNIGQIGNRQGEPWAVGGSSIVSLNSFANPRSVDLLEYLNSRSDTGCAIPFDRLGACGIGRRFPRGVSRARIS